MEQSQDIIFDVDTEKRQFQCSPNFFAKFGREATPLFNSGGRPRNAHVVHPDDKPALLELRRRIYAGEHTAFSVMRIPTVEGRYIWCRIQVTRISRDGAPLRLIGKIVDIDEEVRRRAELERRSQRDSLTDLLNKAAFREQVRSCMPARPEGNRTDALMFMDLDNFKVLNDTLGHVVGDVALVDVAEALKRTFRNVDILGRFGGDEFCIFLRGASPVRCCRPGLRPCWPRCAFPTPARARRWMLPPASASISLTGQKAIMKRPCSARTLPSTMPRKRQKPLHLL